MRLHPVTSQGENTTEHNSLFQWHKGVNDILKVVILTETCFCGHESDQHGNSYWKGYYQGHVLGNIVFFRKSELFSTSLGSKDY